MPRRLFSLLLLVGVSLVTLSSVAGTAASSGTGSHAVSSIGAYTPLGRPLAAQPPIPPGYVFFESPTTGTEGFSSKASTTLFSFDILPPPEPVHETFDDQCYLVDTTNVARILENDNDCDPNTLLQVKDFDTYPNDMDSIPEGEYIFRVTMTGREDPSINQEYNYRWTYDKTPPTNLSVTPTFPIVSVASNNYTKTKVPSFTYSALDNFSQPQNISFFCRLDSNSIPFTPCPANFPSLPAGPHKVQVQARDQAGNPTGHIEYAWIIDELKPNITFSNPFTWVNNGNVSLPFTTADNSGGSGLDASTLSCVLVIAAPFTTCTLSGASYTGLAEGAYTLNVQVSDNVQNASDVASHVVYIDTTKPELTISDPITPSMPILTKSSSASVTFTGQDPLGNGIASGLDKYKCAFTKPNNTTDNDTDCQSTKLYTFSSQGLYIFKLDVNDKVGNPATQKTVSWIYDTVSPAISFTSVPTVTKNNDVTVSFKVDDTAVGSGIKTITCALKGNKMANPQAVPCPGGDGATVVPLVNKAVSLPDLADDSYTLSVTVADRVDNPTNILTSTTFIVDTLPPTVTIDPMPPALTNGNVQINLTGSGTGSNIVAYQCTLFENGVESGTQDCTNASARSYTKDTGTYEVRVTAIDQAGNVSDTPAVATWTVDKSRPDTLVAPVDSEPAYVDTQGSKIYSSSPSTTIFFKVKEPSSIPASGDHFVCNLDNTAYLPCSSPVTYDNLTQAEHTFLVKAIDAAGNEDDVAAGLIVVVDYTEPTVIISNGPNNPSNSLNPLVEFGAFDNLSLQSDLKFRCRIDRWDWTAWGGCSAPNVLAGALLPNGTPLSDGPHTVYVQARDQAGNITSFAVSYSWTTDTTKPDTTITSSTSAITNATQIRIDFVGSDNFSSGSGLSFECSLDGAAWAPCASPRTFSSITDGAHTFRARTKDAAGNLDDTPAQLSWTVDTSVPLTTIDQAIKNTALFSSTFRLIFTGEDNPTSPQPEGPLKFECRLDSGAWEVCDSPKVYTGLAQGNHTFEVRAKDQAGNIENPPASVQKAIDAAQPTTDWEAPVSLPQDPTAAATAVFKFVGADDGGAGLKGFECKLDNEAWVACSSGQTIPSAGSLVDGRHSFQVRAVDNVGNRDESPLTHLWTVDTTKPSVILLAPPAGTLAISNTLAVFLFRGDDGASGSGVVKYECNFDNAGWSACASGQAYPGLAEGSQHTFQVRATDAVDLVTDPPATLTFRVDVTAPDTQLLSPAPATGVVSSTSILFEFTGTDNLLEIGPLRFECSLDNGPFRLCDGTTQQYTRDSLADGKHIFRVRAMDQAGNVDPTPPQYEWTIDATAPKTTILTNPANPTNSRSAVFTFSVDDGAGTGLKLTECRLDQGPWSECLNTLNFSDLVDGWHSFELRATDQIGNRAEPTKFIWLIDSVAPDTLIIGKPANPTNQSTAQFSFAGADPSTASAPGSGLDVFECSLDGGLFSTCPSGITFPGLRNGTHTFRVRARDKAQNVDPSPATYTWVITDAPTGSNIFLPIAKKS